MRLLLDTHALIWWLSGDPLLSRKARTVIADEENEVFVSAASAWEISTKHRLGRLPKAALLAADLPGVLVEQGFRKLPISLEHGLAAGNLAGPHRDPFDRMLIAQAVAADMTLVSNEVEFDRYGVRRVW